MKTIPLVVLLFVFITKLAAGATLPDPVLDIDGKPLQSTNKYYILPVVRGLGGGVTLLKINKTCPLSVVQDQFEVSKGLPLTFSPVTLKGGIIRVSTDQNIKFSTKKTKCPKSSTVWKLGDSDEAFKGYSITTGGVTGKPGRKTIGNWFKIDKYYGYYKLRYCPTVCDVCRVICRDVGSSYKDGERLLGLIDSPFMIKFKKA